MPTETLHFENARLAQQLFNHGDAYVYNGLTGEKLPAGTTFLVALYYAPDGITDENAFTQLGDPIGFFASGLFHGRPQTVPDTPCQARVMAQVRAWESAFGSTYEEAVAAPPLGGVYALAGRSDILRVIADGCPPARTVANGTSSSYFKDGSRTPPKANWRERATAVSQAENELLRAGLPGSTPCSPVAYRLS